MARRVLRRTPTAEPRPPRPFRPRPSRRSRHRRLCRRFEVGAEEVGAAASSTAYPPARSPSVSVRVAGERCAHWLEPVVALLQPVCDGRLRLGAVAEGQELVRPRQRRGISGAAMIQPTFQPVSEKILPAEPILIVRSAIPGSDASGVKCWPSSRHAPHLVADHDQVVLARDRCDRLQLVAPNSRPSGLCGLLSMIARVFGPTAASSACAFDPPSGRLQRHLARRCRRRADHRRIAVVRRRQDDHLVARVQPSPGSPRRAPRSLRSSRRRDQR